MGKQFLIVALVAVLLFVWVMPASAASLLAEEAASVNPPGWLGGLLAALSLLLPVAAVVWMRRQR